MNARPELRLTIELIGTVLNVSWDGMTKAEKAAALDACPDLPRVINDAMSAMRRRYEGEKIPTTGAASRQKLREIAAVLRHGILARAPGLDCEVGAVYHDTGRFSAETGRAL